MDHNVVKIDIKAMLEKAEPHLPDDQCVYKVPSHIRRFKEDAYTPQLISIGPLHHRHPKIQNMERHKQVYCKEFLERFEANLDNLIGHIEEMEPRVRRCYSDTLDLNKEEFVKIILVDSAFIIELFLRDFDDHDEYFLSKPWLDYNLREDLLLLENQLPFFVLESLFTFVSDTDSDDGKGTSSFLQLTVDYFGYYNRSKVDRNDIITIHHFTDLLRTFHIYPLLKKQPSRTNEPPVNLQNATELLEAGVKFKVNTASNCLLDLKFSGSIFELPELIVEDRTEILFRNLVAFEQCHYPFETYIIEYLFIMDFLINTSKDVDVLVKNGILVNWLGNADSVADLFNGLMKNIVQEKFCCDSLHLCQDLNAFCTNYWHNLKATLRRDYGSTPWQTAASIAGIMLLFLTLLQTVCSVLEVVMQ